MTVSMVGRWWVRWDRDVYYRRRRDALHNRNGISGLRMLRRLHGT